MLLPHQVVAQTFKEVSYAPQETKFQLFAPNDAKQITVRVYKDGLGGKAIKRVKMQKTGNECWTATIKGDLMGMFYTFDMGKGECPGVFAKAVGANGKRGAIINMASTDPEHWCCACRSDYLRDAPSRLLYQSSGCAVSRQVHGFD